MKRGSVRDVFELLKRYPFLIGVGAVAFLSTAGLAVIVPTLPLYLKNELGFSTGVIGLLLSVYAVTEIVAKTPFGIWSDRYGRRPVIMMGILLAAFVPLGFIVARSPVSFVLLEVMNGLGVAAFWPILSALIADSVGPEERVPSLAVINMAYLAALGVGPGLGTFVNHFMRSATASFYVAAALLFASSFLAWVVFPKEAAVSGERKGRAVAGESAAEGRSPKDCYNPFYAMLFISLLQQFGIGMLGSTFVIFVNRQLGFSQGEIGTALLVPAAAVALLALPLGQYAERVGKDRAIKFAYMVSAATLAAIPFLKGLWELVVAVAVLALAYVAGTPAWLAIASVVAPYGKKGAAIAGISTMQSIGFIIGSPVGGLLYDKLHPTAPLFACSGMLFVCLFLAVVYIRGSFREESVPVESG
ncbi:MAG: MFS transporter [Thermacetogeniaceae bacterium]